MRQFKLLILLVCMAFSVNALAELRTYSVDPGNGDEIFSALASIVGQPVGNQPAAGSVARLPTGQLLIDTTPEMHQQIAAVLEEISRTSAETTPRVTLQYWVVLGSPGAASAGDTPPVLADVLDEIRQSHGPLAFRLLGNASLVTDSGMQGRTQGDFNIYQLAYVQGTRLQAELNITIEYSVVTGQFQPAEGQNQGPGGVQVNPFQTARRMAQGLQLSTSMEQGEYLVVGEQSVSDDIDGQGEDGGTLFYIVHWPAAN